LIFEIPSSTFASVRQRLLAGLQLQRGAMQGGAIKRKRAMAKIFANENCCNFLRQNDQLEQQKQKI